MAALLIKTFTLQSSSDSKTSYLGKEREVAHNDIGASPDCSSPIASCIKAQSLQEGLMHPMSHWWGWRDQGWLAVGLAHAAERRRAVPGGRELNNPSASQRRLCSTTLIDLSLPQ